MTPSVPTRTARLIVSFSGYSGDGREGGSGAGHNVKEDVRKLYEAYEQNLKDTEKTVIRLRSTAFSALRSTPRGRSPGSSGISRSYVSRLEKRAVEKLREELQRDGVLRPVGAVYGAPHRT